MEPILLGDVSRIIGVGDVSDRPNKKPSTTLASVIIPVRNGADDLPACLDALLAQSYPAVEIIAVDDASTDASAELIAARYPQVKLIRHADNVGFGGACNAGLAAAQGDPLVLLNQDTAVRPDWLAALVDVLQSTPDVGIAGSKALYPDGTIQHAGGVIDERGNGTHRGVGAAESDAFDQLADMDYVTGASLALRRAVYTQIGGLDEGFAPVYFEDVDLCLRARAAGWRVVYAPESVLVHHERSAAAGQSYEQMARFHTNRLRLVLKHWPAARLTDEFLPAEADWLATMGEGGEQLVAALHQAYLTHLLNLGELARHRQALLGEEAGEIDRVAQVLLTLRTVYPLSVVGGEGPPGAEAIPALTDMGELSALRPQPFRSDVPLIGPLIAAFRTQWNRVATEWYLRPILSQQTRFNATTTEALRQAMDARQQDAYQRQRQAEVLAAYLAGQAREIGALTQEIAALKAKLGQE